MGQSPFLPGQIYWVSTQSQMTLQTFTAHERKLRSRHGGPWPIIDKTDSGQTPISSINTEVSYFPLLWGPGWGWHKMSAMWNASLSLSPQSRQTKAICHAVHSVKNWYGQTPEEIKLWLGFIFPQKIYLQNKFGVICSINSWR